MEALVTKRALEVVAAVTALPSAAMCTPLAAGDHVVVYLDSRPLLFGLQPLAAALQRLFAAEPLDLGEQARAHAQGQQLSLRQAATALVREQRAGGPSPGVAGLRPVLGGLFRPKAAQGEPFPNENLRAQRVQVAGAAGARRHRCGQAKRASDASSRGYRLERNGSGIVTVNHTGGVAASLPDVLACPMPRTRRVDALTRIGTSGFGQGLVVSLVAPVLLLTTTVRAALGL